LLRRFIFLVRIAQQCREINGHAIGEKNIIIINTAPAKARMVFVSAENPFITWQQKMENTNTKTMAISK
jgi:hypothetical protein